LIVLVQHDILRLHGAVANGRLARVQIVQGISNLMSEEEIINMFPKMYDMVGHTHTNTHTHTHKTPNTLFIFFLLYFLYIMFFFPDGITSKTLHHHVLKIEKSVSVPWLT